MSFLDTYKGKKVLITGHTGFKGAWLSHWLLRLGADVTGFSLPDLPTEPCLFESLGLADRMRDFRGDISDTHQVRDLLQNVRPDFLFHLAAQPLVRESYHSPVKTIATNVMGAVSLLEALRVSGHACVAFFSATDKCYREKGNAIPCREEDPLGGAEIYSASKAAAEIIIEGYRQAFFSHTDCPVRVASGRAGNVLGGGDWAHDRILPDAIRHLQEGKAIPVRNADMIRPWQHVLDPLAGYLLLVSRMAEDPRFQGAWNFGPDLSSQRSVRALVEEILTHWPGSWIAAGEANPPHENPILCLDSSKAVTELGWRPAWPFERAVAETLRGYRSQDFRAVMDHQLDDYAKEAGW